jgi:1-acyl-sn-glycerol-3-phosphate acyltransferase
MQQGRAWLAFFYGLIGEMWSLRPNLRFVFSSRLIAALVLLRLLPSFLWFVIRRDFSALARGVARAFEVQIKIEGLEHLPKTPCVLLPLHEGLFDVVALLHLPCKMRFAARFELLSWQVLGDLLRQAGVLEVNPEQPISSYRRLLRQTPSLIGAGESLVIFPQGSVCGLEVDFQHSAFAIAKKFGLPIVPIVLTGAHRVWDHPFAPQVRLGASIAMTILEPVQNPDPTELKRQLKHLAMNAAVPPRRYLPSRDGYWDNYRLDIDPDFPEVFAQMELHRRDLAKVSAPAKE